MSADNGIYIIKSPVIKDGVITGESEYRVAECSAIDNIATTSENFKYNNKPYSISDLYEVSLFGKSPVFSTKKEAMSHASDIEDRIGAEGYYTEYGIRTILRTNTFPPIPYDEASKILSAFYKSLSNKM